MTWIHINRTTTRTDPDGNEVEIKKGLPRRAPYMDAVLDEHDYDPEDYLPLEYTENRKANVPKPLAEAMASEYDFAEITSED